MRQHEKEATRPQGKIEIATSGRDEGIESIGFDKASR